MGGEILHHDFLFAVQIENVDGWAGKRRVQIDAFHETIAKGRATDQAVLVRNRRYNTGTDRDANIFPGVVKGRSRAIVGGSITENAFLGIPGESTFDTKILHCVTVKAQGHISVQHGNATVGFSDSDV